MDRAGLLLPSREALLWRNADFRWLVKAAVTAEKAGFDSVWVGDSLLARPRGEPVSLLSAIAATTSKVTLGTAVLLPLLRNPLMLAQQLATLDRIAEGRLVVTAGPGNEVPGTHTELKAVGVRSDHRVGDMLATLERIRSVWSGKDEVQLEPRPYRAEGPPIWLAAHGPRMLRATGEKYDGWMPISPTPEVYASGLRAVREAAERAGRDPKAIEASAYLTIAVADTASDAAANLDAYIRAYYGAPAEVMARNMALHAGTREQAREWFGAFREAGAEHLVLRLARPRLDDYDSAITDLLAAAR